MNHYVFPIILSAIAGSATILGYALTRYHTKWVKRYAYGIVSLAAGVLLGTAFFHLLPEANELIGGDASFTWLLVGFIAFFIVEALIGFHACIEGEEHDHEHVLGSVAGAGLFFHSLLDGIAIAVGFELSTSLGLVTALAVTLHELPEGIFTFSLLTHGKRSEKKAGHWTIAVALATPLGTLLTLLLAPDLSEAALGILLAVAAGSFLYISASDLIPESHKPRSLRISILMLLGLLGMFLINNALHSHEGEEEHGHEEEEHLSLQEQE